MTLGLHDLAVGHRRGPAVLTGVTLDVAGGYVMI